MTSSSRLRRLALHLFGSLSVLLLLATIALWILSPWRSVHILRQKFSYDATTWFIDNWSAESTRGSIVFIVYNYHRTDPPATVLLYASTHPPGAQWHASLVSLSSPWWDDTTWYHHLGFHWMTQVESIYTNRVLILPHWLFAALFATTTLLWIIAARRARQMRARVSQNLCLACGYDLRGNPAAGRCPECGTAYGGSNLPPA